MEARQATKKKEQKAARQQREQQRQKQREQEEQEKEEQRRFAALSDREKVRPSSPATARLPSESTSTPRIELSFPGCAVYLWDSSLTSALFFRELWLQSADLLPSWEPRALQFLTLQLAKLGMGARG